MFIGIKDHLGNVRLSYSDSNKDGIIAPAGAIVSLVSINKKQNTTAAAVVFALSSSKTIIFTSIRIIWEMQGSVSQETAQVLLRSQMLMTITHLG